MKGPTLSERASRFWDRVTEGMQVSELWNQFRSDAQSSYRLYSRDVDMTRDASVRRGHHAAELARQFFWAILEKLTPARRILLLLALVLIAMGAFQWTWHSGSGEMSAFSIDARFWGALLLLALFIMEVGDRVVMKRDLQIAKEIQAWLLPAEPPAVPGVEIAFATRPANTVAGDYYDVFARPGCTAENAKFLMAIADVAGKSVPAAMLMATFQASLRTLSSRPGTLTELASSLNRYACSNSQNGRRFTTAVIAEYDPRSRGLTYVNAGHNNPILLRRNGSVERLSVGGVPIGVMDNPPYQAGEVTLETGDWLVAFTDGVVEAENQQQQEYGEERFLTMLRWGAGAGLTPGVMLQHLLADIDRFEANAPQHDDITCMLLRVV
jgi:phosphoserine phosphatase RsbU/P